MGLQPGCNGAPIRVTRCVRCGLRLGDGTHGPVLNNPSQILADPRDHDLSGLGAREVLADRGYRTGNL